MKKYSRSGFVLAETLVVAVFLMVIFSMIYYYFYPLMGEYEKREVYDSVDDKYSVYWLKRLIEDSSYQVSIEKKEFFTANGYLRFECSDLNQDDQKKSLCKTLVDALQVQGCDVNGDSCAIFLTKYCLTKSKSFKETVDTFAKNNKPKYSELCNKSEADCINDYVNKCKKDDTEKEIARCTKVANESIFNTGVQDYVQSLPDYTAGSVNGAKYRIVTVFQHTMDNNNYYSYATIEVR